MRGKITKTVVDNLVPEPRNTFLWDTEITGFGCRISAIASLSVSARRVWRETDRAATDSAKRTWSDRVWPMQEATTPDTIELDPKILKRLSRVSTPRWLFAAGVDWLVISLAVLTCLRFGAWPIWLAAVLIIGNRQHALGVLMHEATHFRVSRNRRWNDVLGDVFAGYPVFMPTANYRVFHFRHHQRLDMSDDPEGRFFDTFPADARFPQNPWRFGLLVLRDLSGLWPRPLVFFAGLVWTLPGQRRWHILPIALLHGAVIGAAVVTGTLQVYALLWILPLITVFPATQRIRAMSEHHGIEEAGSTRYHRDRPDVLRTTRSISGRLGPALFGPHGINYHLEHHLYPSVPFHNLPELSRELARRHPEEIGSRIRTSYWRAIGECLERPRRSGGS